MRYLLLLIAILAMPVCIYAEDLFPEELLPTISTDPHNTLKGGEYQLELLPFKEEPSTTPTPVKKPDMLSSKDRETFEQKGYILKEVNGEIKLSLSSSRVGLGSVSGKGIYRGSTEIGVSSSVPTSYSLFLQQKNDEVENGIFRPTQCDMENETCSPAQAAQWKKEMSYGFGYTAFGPDISKDFKNETFFRSFSTQIPFILAEKEKIDGLRTIKLDYKLQTPSSTEEAIYSTNVEIIASSK